ncbi:MAG: N-acetylmuramoyl-L-alanine amidase [Syntrophales bacterium]
MQYVAPTLKVGKMKKFKIIIIYTMLVMLGIVCLAGQSAAQKERISKAIIIDAGHGGTDYGVKVSDTSYEKDINLRIALALQKELTRAGYKQIILTRSTDREIPLKERIQLIKNNDPLLVISIHANGGFGNKSKGYEIYFPGFRADKEARSEPAAIIKDMTKNKHLNDSVRLAQYLQKYLDGVFPKENRGLREAPIPLMEGINVPAVVIEIGFLTNKENRNKITDDKVQQEIAKAIGRGVKEAL